MISRLLAGLLCAAVVAGCATTDRQAAPSDDLVLKQKSDDWDQAIVRKDRAAIEANMADDFRQLDGAGNVETKRSFVDGLVDPDLAIDPYVVEDFEIRRYGNVALLSGRTRMTGRYEAKEFRSHYRYIDVYVKTPEGWRIVSVQITKVAP